MSAPEASAIPIRVALGHVMRAVRYVRPFWPRLLGKTALLYLGLAVLLLLPWPVKVLIDQYIVGLPFDEATRVPAFLRPLYGFLVGDGGAGTLLRVAAIQLGLVFLVGAAGSGDSRRSSATVSLQNGVDQASTTENQANAAFTLIGGLIGLADVRYTIRLTQDMNHRLRTHLFDRLVRQPLARHYDGTVGDAIYRVMYDSAAITTAVYEVVLSPLASIPFAVVLVILLSTLFGDYPVIPFLAGTLLFVGLVGTAPFAAAIRRWDHRSRARGADAAASLEEGLHNVAAVQGLGAEKQHRAAFDRESWASFARFFRLVVVILLLIGTVSVPVLFIVGTALRSIVDLVVSQSMSPGDFTILITYFLMLGSACYDVGTVWLNVQGASVGLHRVFEMMDLPPEEERPEGRPCPSPLRSVRLEGVSYAYPGGPEVVHDIDLELAVGRVVALVGPAGAGKSTIAQLVPGFLHPQKGRVTYDGIDAHELDVRSLRDEVAYVFQESALIDGSVAENLRRALPTASDDQLHRALERASATDVVDGRADGLDARVGVAGGKLSIGQRQRLALARGLLRETPFVLLDEPTSALDAETERKIEKTMYDLRSDHAVLLIAHRLALVERADEILYVDGGRIRERGTHQELMSREDGAYRRLVEMQA